jgi:hypothetical protein
MVYLFTILIIVFIFLYLYFYFSDNSYRIFEELGHNTRYNFISLKVLKKKINSLENSEIKNRLIKAYKNRIMAWFCLIVILILFILVIFVK